MDHRASRRAALLWGLLAAGLLAGCKQETAEAPLTRVKVVTAQVTDFAPGNHLHRRGRRPCAQRCVVSRRRQDQRAAGQYRRPCHGRPRCWREIDPDEQQADVRGRNAGVQSAEEAVLRQGDRELRPPERPCSPPAPRRGGNTTRPRRPTARPGRSSTSARAQLAQATDQLAYTELRAGADGVIVGRMAGGRSGRGPGAADLQPGARRRPRCRVQRLRMGDDQRRARQGSCRVPRPRSGGEDHGRHARRRAGGRSQHHDGAGQVRPGRDSAGDDSRPPGERRRTVEAHQGRLAALGSHLRTRRQARRVDRRSGQQHGSR